MITTTRSKQVEDAAKSDRHDVSQHEGKAGALHDREENESWDGRVPLWAVPLVAIVIGAAFGAYIGLQGYPSLQDVHGNSVAAFDYTNNASMPASRERPAVDAVRSSITTVDAYGRSYRTGALAGGMAVLVDDLGAYWYYQGQVYAANGIARTWSPRIQVAGSSDIRLDNIKLAVNGRAPVTHIEKIRGKSKEGKNELQRCLAEGGPADCDYELIALAYDDVVPRSIAVPDSWAEGLNIVVTCLGLKSRTFATYSTKQGLESGRQIASNALRQGVCKGNIGNLHRVEF
jgi:hypothetical protein